MDQKTFIAEAERDGYREIEVKSWPAGKRSDHAHDFDVLGLVLEGRLTIASTRMSETYGPGEVFRMAAHVAHTEDVAPGGVRFVVGRRG